MPVSLPDKKVEIVVPVKKADLHEAPVKPVLGVRSDKNYPAKSEVHHKKDKSGVPWKKEVKTVIPKVSYQCFLFNSPVIPSFIVKFVTFPTLY